MKQIILFLFILTLAFDSSGQSNYLPPIYSVVKDSNVVYGIDSNFKGCLVALDLDIYKPINKDTCRPLLIMIHGGSFIGGDKTDAEEVYIAQAMASRGYVVASINYRLGYQITNQQVNPLSDCGGFISDYCVYLADTSELIRAAYRAMQDARGAIRYMKGRHSIDSTNINSAFVGGFSAGAVTTLLVDFIDTSSKRPADTYNIADAPTPSVSCTSNNPCSSTSLARPDLGGVQGNLNLNGYDASIQGALSFSGALLSLDTTILKTVGKEPALYLYHQTCDDIVPCYRGQVYGPVNNCLYYCTSCSPVTAVPYCYGGGAIAKYIRSHPSLNIQCDSQIVTRGPAINSYYGCLFGNSNEPYCANSAYYDCHAIVLDSSLIDTIATFLNPFINSCNTPSGISNMAPIHPQFTILNNPSTDYWTICNSDTKLKINSIKLYSTLGTSIPMVLNYRGNCISISSSELSQGIYFLRLETNEGATTIKLLR